MRSLLLLLVVLLFLANHLPELRQYHRKDIAEFCQGLRWYRADLDDQAVIWLLRGLVAALGIALFGLLAVGLLG